MTPNATTGPGPDPGTADATGPAVPSTGAQPSPHRPPHSGLRADAAVAARLTVPVAMGYLPLGAAFGILLVSQGLPWYWAPTTALVVFAGSLEFLAVSMLTAPLGFPAIAMTTFLVNFRHIFYGLSFPLHLLQGKAQRSYGIFALTDETYSLLAANPGQQLNGRRITLIQLFSHAYWVLGSLTGALVSTALPDDIHGIEFALTALFVVLSWDHATKRTNLRPVLYGLAASAVAAVAGTDQFLTVAVITYLLLLIGDYLKTRTKRA
ncbi:AzlC family ABC transporter permease [Streptomyces olivaceiscleroticus]|uniref:AzlC family ABC transporter permease n=1 Tax=Streptomyces olivaceiscleroticus TaxID=68245 RepID=A0ABP3KCF6_9ACTN